MNDARTYLTGAASAATSASPNGTLTNGTLTSGGDGGVAGGAGGIDALKTDAAARATSFLQSWWESDNGDE